MKKDKRIEKMKNFFDMGVKKTVFAEKISVSRQHLNWLIRTNGTKDFKMTDSLWGKIEKGMKSYKV